LQSQTNPLKSLDFRPEAETELEPEWKPENEPRQRKPGVAWSFAIEARTKLWQCGFEWILISSWGNK